MQVHRCPKCGSFNLHVAATIDCSVQQEITSPYTKNVKTTPTMLGDGIAPVSWSGESQMICQDCGHLDRAVEFVTEFFPTA